MRFALFLMTVFIIAIPAQGASAQDIDPEMLETSGFCTTPRDVEEIAPMDKKRWKYCDIQMRQFEYRERVIELRKRLNTRSENFKNSTYAVKQNYKKELQKYHDSLGSSE